MHCCGGRPAGWSKLASEPQRPDHYGRPSVFAFSRSQGFSCLEVKRRSVCVCFPGSVCVCQHRRLSRGDARPPADSQRANYRIIRRERGHMCGVASAPTTHTHTHTLRRAHVKGGLVPKKRGSQRSLSPVRTPIAGAEGAERPFPADDPRSQSLRPRSPSIPDGRLLLSHRSALSITGR